MSDADALLGEINQILASQTVSYTTASKPYDVYEGYIFALIADTATQCNAQVYYQNVFGRTTDQLVFRTGPGSIHGTSQPYTHAVLSFAGAPDLEAHIGVRVQGNSGVLHECDVLVLPRAEADLSRNARIAPRGNQCLLAVECKYYVADLGLELARNFEGLHADLRAKHQLFVANTDSASVVKYLSARKHTYEHRVVPGARQVEFLRGHIRAAFKSHLGRYTPSAAI